MVTSVRAQAAPRLTLSADTAADLMMPNPVSIRGNATLREAVVLLTDKGFSAAPVVDHAGRPIGVVSRSDVLAHDREMVECSRQVPDSSDQAEPVVGPAVTHEDPTRAADIMTPAVF